jgi:hypothetical protein
VALAGVVLLPRAFYAANEFASASLGAVFFTLGAVAARPLVRWLQAHAGFRGALLYLALMTLAPAGFGMALPPGELAAVLPAANGAPVVMHHPALWFAAATLFFYRPIEQATRIWPAGYLKEVGASERGALLWLCGFWAALLGMRLLTGSLFRPGHDGWWLLAFSGLTAVTLGNLLGIFRQAPRGLGLILVGLCLAPVLPALIALMLRTFPREPGSAFGLVFAFGAAGSALVPWLLSPASERHAPRAAIGLSLGFSLALTGTALVLALLS